MSNKLFAMVMSTVVMILSCASSKTVIIGEPLIKNPTFYIFSKSKQEVEKAVIEAFGGHKSSKRSWFDNYFLVKYLNGDIKLIPNNGNLSKVYFRKSGETYLYCPNEIRISIYFITESSTKVSIGVVEPKVRTRLTLLPTIPWMQRGWKYKSVPATTVEEYEILLMIGKELQEKNMPALKIPDKVVF